MGFSTSLMPVKSLQVTRLRLVTWKDFTGIRDVENPYSHFRITGLTFQENKKTTRSKKLNYVMEYAKLLIQSFHNNVPVI